MPPSVIQFLSNNRFPFSTIDNVEVLIPVLFGVVAILFLIVHAYVTGRKQ